MSAMSNPYEQYPSNNPSPYGGQPYGMAPQEHPQGTIVLVLGILAFFVGITAPFAWYMGSKAMKEIRASGVRYSNESQLNIGRILGMVLTILYAISLVGIIVFFIIIAVVAVNQPR
jgi:hypothetical protein